MAAEMRRFELKFYATLGFILEYLKKVKKD